MMQQENAHGIGLREHPLPAQASRQEKPSLWSVLHTHCTVSSAGAGKIFGNLSHAELLSFREMHSSKAE